MTDGIAHLVDDDDAIRDALSWLLRSRGVASKSWNSAEAFLAAYRADMGGCLVLDIRMSGMSGPELFDRLLTLGCTLPTIFLTGHGDVPQAVQSLKKGAFDFMEKPCNDNELADRIIAALEFDRQRRRHAASAASIESRLLTLTSREREVMDRILAGQYNKVIAADLNIAMRTVEVHRARIFEKMAVKSAVELAQLLPGNAQD
jgi:two-component system, LuxR family, response regulator DctR